MTASKRAAFAGMVAAFAITLGGAAVAQQKSGSTTGPAAGSNVEPSTITEKKMGNAGQPGKESVGVGAPGVAAVQGSESGSQPAKK